MFVLDAQTHPTTTVSPATETSKYQNDAKYVFLALICALAIVMFCAIFALILAHLREVFDNNKIQFCGCGCCKSHEHELEVRTEVIPVNDFAKCEDYIFDDFDDYNHSH